MKYLSFIRHSESDRDTTPPPALMEAMGKFIEKCRAEGTLVDTGGLLPSKEGVIIRSSRGKLTVKDGPFTESKEVIGGWAILQGSKEDVLRVATEVSTYDEEAREAWRAIVERFIDAGAEHIRSEQQRGLISARLDPRATAEALVWMNERYSYIYLGRDRRSTADAVEALVPVWTAALYPGVIPAEQLRPASS